MKRIFLIGFFLFLGFSNIIFAEDKLPIKAIKSGTNLAGYPIANVIDGNYQTYAEGTKLPDYIQQDLGAAYPLTKLNVMLPPVTAWGKRTETFSIDGSLDGLTWTPLVATKGYIFDATTTGNGNKVSIPLTGTARYLRENFTLNSSSIKAYQISEIEAFGILSTSTPTPTPVPITKTISFKVPSFDKITVFAADQDMIGAWTLSITYQE